ncbi:MAG TPA: 16S rRNA (uracil(1498)-N(3))-methyltransferase [Thermodesulfobacteriota bacterium]|nr:16S rRNA (uracil(1498)-N(3))-methyltransferase [Thermodesulfobacteriota bacterium]
MPRFPITPGQIKNETATITGPDYRHIVNVLRLRPGNDVVLFEEGGVEYEGKITEINKREVKVLIRESRDVKTESGLNITLLQGIPKGDKMDWIVEKSTELGVRTIIPVITERSQIRESRKIQRWQRIANESIKQCGRVKAPKILTPLTFDAAIKFNNNSKLKLMFYEKAETRLINNMKNTIQPIDDITLLFGPEGGFSENEVKLAIEEGFTPIGLGPRILRTETAGIVALSILQFLFGDI